MRITAVKTHALELPLRTPFETSFGRFRSRCIAVVTVESEGAMGVAECPVFGPNYSYETLETALFMIEQHIGPAVVGQDLRSPEAYLAQVAHIRGHPFARSAVELALWDLWAQESGQPLWRLAGGVRGSVPSQISIGVKTTVEDLLSSVNEGIDQGYRQIKIKIRPGWDFDVVERVRQAFPDVPLMVDANGGYTLEDLPMLRRLDRLNLTMIEQPFHHADLQDHSVLQRELATPVCIDESADSIHSVRAAIALGSCRIVNIKIPRVGGLFEAKRIASLCTKSGLTVWCGGMVETGLGASYNLVAASLPEFVHPNDITPSFSYFDVELVRPHIELAQDGMIELPEEPGIGREVDWDVVRRFRTGRTLRRAWPTGDGVRG